VLPWQEVALGANVEGGRVHDSAVFVSELVGNWRHGGGHL
jgi:hypothetical protein